MPVTPVTLPNVFDLIVTHQNNADPAIKWRNTMTFHSPVNPVTSDLIVEAIAGFFDGSIWADCSIVEVACYAWARGRQPYPTGSAIFIETVSVPGSASSIWSHLASPHTPAGGEVVLRVDHLLAGRGKPGRTFLRGLLGEDDLSALSGGKWTFSGLISNLQLDLATLLTTTHLSTFFGAGTGDGRYLVGVRYSPKTGIVAGFDQLEAMQVIGVSTNKLSRKNRR